MNLKEYTVFDVLLLTCDQLAWHVSDAAAGFSHSFDRDRVTLATEQPRQLAVGERGLTGDVVAWHCCGRDHVRQSSITWEPSHQGCLRVAVHHCLDKSRFTGNWKDKKGSCETAIILAFYKYITTFRVYRESESKLPMD